MTDYRPIDCALHGDYELAILQRHRLQLTWLDSNNATHLEVITPTDLLTRQGEEFMFITRRGGQIEEIRLDRIIRYHNA
jgi:transcriptional antiterminator Rof (Rho-off)